MKDDTSDAAASPFDPWQPVDSIMADTGERPFDGHPVIVGIDGDVWVGEAYWDHERQLWYEANTHWTDAVDGAVYGVTHWQPLPAPPGEAVAGEKAGLTQAARSDARPPPSDIREALEELVRLVEAEVSIGPGEYLGRVLDKCRAALTSSPPGDGKLREALEPFAALGGPNDGVMAAYYDCPDDLVVYANSGRGITAGDVREARRLLGMLHAPRAHQIPVWPEGQDACTPPLSPWREAIEAAAKVCDERGQWAEDKIKDGDDLTFAHYSNACNDCAEMVRSLSPPAGDAG